MALLICCFVFCLLFVCFQDCESIWKFEVEKLLSVWNLQGRSMGRKCREKNDAADVGLSYEVSGGSLSPLEILWGCSRVMFEWRICGCGSNGLRLGLP